MNIEDNLNFKSVELLDEDIDIPTLLNSYGMTDHAYSDRYDRVEEALKRNRTDGKQAPFDRIFRVDKDHANGMELHCITKNGIIFILNEEKFRDWKPCIVTVLFARVNQVKRLYEKAGLEFPESIHNKCKEWIRLGLNES